jgi:hypothetical protein
MSPENQTPNEDPPMSEYLQQVETQKEQMSDARELQERIEEVLELQLAAQRLQVLAKDAASQLNIHMLKRRESGRDFTFKVSSLPSGSVIMDINQGREVESNVSEFKANMGTADNYSGIDLIHTASNTRVKVLRNSNLKISPVFEATPNITDKE